MLGHDHFSLMMFVCLLRIFRPVREFFYSYGDVTINCEGLLILTYTQHSWLLRNEGSLAGSVV